MICTRCERDNPAEACFCMHCAAPLPRRCGACDAPLPEGARFCPACAHPAAAGTQAPAARPVAVPEDRDPRSYTPRHLAERILHSRAALEGERKQVTVLFADVKGSLELADQAGAEAWHGILDGFFQILTAGIHRFEGTVNQYTGDGIMALFGAPLAHEDHAQRACYAALWLRDELRRYADELRRSRGLNFSVRIGLNSGEVVVGRIGDDLRMDYTAQGLTVGLAQRMEQLAAADSTYLTAHTARLVEGFFALRDLGDFSLKGVTEPLRVYELQGTGALRTRLDLSRARGLSRFVGRSDELGVLDAALERAVAGRGGVVGVVADAGVGKSRLCLEFSERCRARGVPVFSAHCPAHGKLIPLLPVYELMRDVFGIAESDSSQATREKIAGRMLLLDRELEGQLPLAFDFLGVPDPMRPLETVDSAQKQRDLARLLRRLVEARSAREPGVLLLDDVHWIDSSSDEHLASLVETIPHTRTLLLLNFRPEYGAPWMGSSSYQQLPLLPLGDEAIEELLTHLLGSHPSTRPLRPTIRERAAGNPFFVEEIVQALVEAGSLRGERGATVLEGPVDRLRVPSSVQAILAARIDRLAAREKGLLQAAAAIGRRFSDPLLRRVCRLPADAYDEALAALRRAELVHEAALYPEVEYAFRHPLTHEVAQASQLSEQRRAVHAKVAAALEELHADRLDEQAALLAHHWDVAGEAPPAARWHRRAAEHIAGGNPPEAKRHWERVRELADQLDDERLALELGQQSRLMILEYGWRLGVTREEADALLAEGEAWAKAQDDRRALAALYNAFSMPCAFSLGEVVRARDMAREGLRLAQQAGDEVLSFALELRVFFASEPLGVVADAEQAIEAASRHTPAVMDAASPLVGYDARSTAVGIRAWPELFSGRLAQALADVQRGIALARERKASETAGWLLGVESDVRRALGESSLALAREAYEIAERIDSHISRVFAATTLAAALMAEGDTRAALAVLERVEPLASDGFKHVEPYVLSQLAVARCRLGDGDGARSAAERALELARQRRLGRSESFAHVAWAEVALAEGGPEGQREARAALDAALSKCRELGVVLTLPEIHELRARVATAEGDTAARESALREAMALYEKMGAPRQVQRVAELLAR